MAKKKKTKRRAAGKAKALPPPPPPPQAKRGRPSRRSPAIEDAMLLWIAKGGTLRAFCRQPGMPDHVTVYDWLHADRDFSERFARAREIGADWIGEEILEIADTPQMGQIVTSESGGEGGAKRSVKKEDMLGHRRLQIEARFKLLAKWFPKKWGEKLDLKHSGTTGFDALLRKVLGTEEPKPDDKPPEEKTA